MIAARRLVPVLLAAVLVVHAAWAQQPEGWHRADLVRPQAPKALVVLLPGYGGTAAEFADSGTLARRLSSDRIALVALWPTQPTLYFDGESVARLDGAIATIAGSLGLGSTHVVVGGSSVGGTGAIQLAERCLERRCALGGRLAAVFAVDSPIDLERIWRGEELTIRRAPPSANVAESRVLLDAIRKVLGGSPAMRQERYRALSPFAAFADGGGRAVALRDTPLRAYTEPDVQWWIRERGLDYYAMNAVDAAALVNQLRLLGNARAELITTSGRGFRPDGTRHPHSWSIVDQGDLANWLAGLLAS